jgi:hypothetical protein
MNRIMKRLLKITMSACVMVIATGAVATGQIVWDSGLSGKAVKGVMNVTSSIISDSFIPMTHYSAGELNLVAVPAYFTISRAFDDPDLRGDDLKGWAAALGAGYALDDRLMVYGIVSALHIGGTIEARDYDNYTFDVDYTLLAANAGAGYDLIPGGSTWSVPVFAGVSLQRYRADVTLSPLNSGYADPLNVTIDGEGFLYAVTAGCAVSKTLFDRIRVTPYFLYIYGINRPQLTAHASQYIAPFTYTADYDLTPGRVNNGMAGLALTLLSKKDWSLSASFGGILTSSTGWYNRHFLDGLTMKSIVVAASYRAGAEGGGN